MHASEAKMLIFKQFQKMTAILFKKMAVKILKSPEELPSHHCMQTFKDILVDILCLVCPENHPCSMLTRQDFNKLSSEQVFMMNPENALFLHRQILPDVLSLIYPPGTIPALLRRGIPFDTCVRVRPGLSTAC